MANNIIKFIPATRSPCGSSVASEMPGTVNTKKWIGRIAIFELSTGTRVQGKILAISEEWLDTDTGAIRIRDIIHAKWVTEEEASIIRGGPLNNNSYRLR